ncbi:phosphatidylinositol-glycan biosynthesis class f protein-related [Holotrichia oblita]|uniref:Phosphatidylinositol-glycan biosynthesis class f protein-related n=1 Tax=Holotrichia oblita TaxID=644536 RepID=A0ACB9TER5_HOLOL|nr:phosphatidylinositol-glycan biosynthesis class f protein-related [Holotrichia oblita]
MGLFSGKCRSTARLDGKTVIITGSNTGIGKTTARDLFKRGAHVIMACRNTNKAKEAAQEICNLHNNSNNHKDLGKLEVVELNLCSLHSIRECSKEILQKQRRIDILINNAGVMCCPYGKTEDGFEIQFSSNYLGHFLFTILLLPRIIESKSARIINVSSVAHKMGKIDFNDLNWESKPYSALEAYQQSKLCQVLFTRELHRQLREAHVEGVNVYSLHPGVITTELGRHLNKTYFFGLRWILSFVRVFFKTPKQGAQTTVYCAVDEIAGEESGLYYADCKPVKPSKNAENVANAKMLWKISLEMVNLPKYNPFTV